MFVRVRATGQVEDFAPFFAALLLNSGMGEPVRKERETGMLNRAKETAALWFKKPDALVKRG